MTTGSSGPPNRSTTSTGNRTPGPPAPRRNDVDPPIRGRLAADDRFDGVAVLHADWNQTYSAAEYRQLMTSYSATQTMEPDARERLLDDIEGLVRNGFDGEVTRPLVVTLTMAKYRPGDRPSER